MINPLNTDLTKIVATILRFTHNGVCLVPTRCTKIAAADDVAKD
jgi:hypothetical protein